MTTLLIDGMSRALWVSTWAGWNDEYKLTRTPPQCELMDLAPPTPPEGRVIAATLLGATLRANDLHLSPALLVHRMAAAQGLDFADIVLGFYDRKVRYFGHCLAMASLGTGVSWFDDHNEFPLVIQDIDLHISDFFGEDWYTTPYYEKENNTSAASCGS